MATNAYSVKHRILLSLTDKAVKYISMDCSNVAQKLVSISVLPESFICSSKEKEIFETVLKAVELDPNNFEKFLSVIEECPAIKGLAELIRDKYEEEKKQAKVCIANHCP